MLYNYEDIKELTAKKYGISTVSLGESFIKDSLASYLESGNLVGNEDDDKFLAGFFEYIKVPETWFFRQPESFDCLKNIVLKRLQNHSGKIRILSIACSTGEEAYSIAMTLDSAGINKERYTLDAIDLSAASIAKAKEGVYGKNSFRQPLTNFANDCFALDGNLFRLNEKIKSIPNFITCNFLDTKSLSGGEKYDFIFCRNLLIYFTEPARKKAIDKIKDLLSENGFVFSGFSEFVFFLQQGFTALDYKLSFSCFLKDEKKKNESSAHFKNHSSVQQHYVNPFLVNDKETKKIVYTAPEPDFCDLELLANSGDYEQAKTIAHQVMLSDAANPAELTISGVLFWACEMPEEALICLERAVYLNPNQEDALFHLALIYENTGKEKQAELLKKRIRKIQLKCEV